MEEALVFLQQEQEEDEEADEVRAQSALLLSLIAAGALESQRLREARQKPNRLYLTRSELLPNPRQGTPWQKLHESRSDRAFITTMGFDVLTFEKILADGFADLWNTTPIPRNDTWPSGRPRLGGRSLDAAGVLGLILHYVNSTMRMLSLEQIFALIPSTISRYINFSIDILLSALRRMPEAKVSWPKGDEFEENNQLIAIRHPRLVGAFGTIDGLNLITETSNEPEIENASFNSWLQKHVTSNVIAFSAEGMYIFRAEYGLRAEDCLLGTIIACRLNGPGSWHDSRMARDIYKKLLWQTPDGFYLVADTAFPRGTDSIKGRIQAPIKSGEHLPADRETREEFLRFNNELTSFRQAAEWGMRQLQGSFGRLRIPLDIDETKRGDLLEVIVRLFNLRTRLVGINQIRSVYMPIWKKDEQEEIWNEFEKIVFRRQRENDRVSCFYLAASYD
jgi:hypothetical protein